MAQCSDHPGGAIPLTVIKIAPRSNRIGRRVVGGVRKELHAPRNMPRPVDGRRDYGPGAAEVYAAIAALEARLLGSPADEGAGEGHHFETLIVRADARWARRVRAQVEGSAGGERKVRNDAVRALHIVAGQLGEDRAAWLAAAAAFLGREFGDGHVIALVAHVRADRAHLHALIVPIDAAGHLNARAFVGHHDLLRNLRVRYREAMRPHGAQESA